jgi:hypothetical protein
MKPENITKILEGIHPEGVLLFLVDTHILAHAIHIRKIIRKKGM